MMPYTNSSVRRPVYMSNPTPTPRGGRVCAGDVVVMVPNHRQGVLGFLNPSDVASMNVVVAVNDVWSALQWARDHAASFGGDPKQLVLVGYGSGAYLLSSVAKNMSKDMARRAFYRGPVFGSFLPFNPVGFTPSVTNSRRTEKLRASK
ncbi:hypothetical protein HPB51_027331 [Rhipicephalus microplus]|uniref:Carboxylesterase type B domain-containing protein n=1 Tax=Rhipicephalus microplus TaxID=6941 RepID=A0A9J6D0Q5_RHIMP|nr:hypothetical protein HPB51_027331 [Rhipicephalus microplus]